ncbi:MAG: molybdenum cofactor biosynthesis protein MoaE [Planctomycetes bacterium]|nr:molybdenum cofactor biosynthesis protein MoaE [Planctomycetota bacterium]
MKLCIRLFAVLRERAGTHEVSLDDLPDGITVAELKLRLGQAFPELGDLSSVAGVVGTEYVREDRVLLASDEVALLPPVSGGESDYERGVFRMVSGGIDASGLEEVLIDDACGGLATFRGLTRRSSRGRQDVRYLDYEIFEAMAGPEMDRIFEACRARFGPEARGPLRMLCVHSQGRVLVGQTSVVIAVATPHRDTAFAACRFLIDTLKERLPIWKKEVYADGEAWVEGCSHHAH